MLPRVGHNNRDFVPFPNFYIAIGQADRELFLAPVFLDPYFVTGTDVTADSRKLNIAALRANVSVTTC